MGSSRFLSTLKKAATVAGDVLTTKGDLLSRSASALGRLAVGSNGKVLTCKSSESLGISWETPASGGNMELLNSVTTSSSQSSHTFTQDLTKSDTSRILIFIVGKVSGACNMNLQINGGTSSNNWYAGQTVNGSGVRTALTAGGVSTVPIASKTVTLSGAVNVMANCELFISTVNASAVTGQLSAFNFSNLYQEEKYIDSEWISSSTITSLKIDLDSSQTFVDGTKITIYRNTP